jgi:hypothetical protein
LLSSLITALSLKTFHVESIGVFELVICHALSRYAV